MHHQAPLGLGDENEEAHARQHGKWVGGGERGGGGGQQRVRPGKLDSLPDYSISFEEGSESVEEGSQEGSESTHTHTHTHKHTRLYLVHW